MTRRVAVLGATGLVGRTLLRLLETRSFPTETPRLLGSEAGRTLPWRGRLVPVEAVSERSFDDIDLALFAVANPLAERWAPVARAAGATVIDNSSAHRYHADVPLVVPEINGALLESRPTLIANPNCSTAAIVMALAPLTRMARLERLIVATYQATSGGGAETLEAFEHGIRAGLDDAPPPRAGGLPPLAYNVVPQIDRFEENGYTREEMKIVWETRKILDLPELPVSATAVRVPVRVGHSVAVNAAFDRDLELDEVRRRWAEFPGLEVVDEPALARYPTPLAVTGRDEVLVGRLRVDLSQRRGLAFFVCSDNLLKGAALNALQIAEALLRVGARV
jgi:aspartate-semialdehyde dehydrogenase